ncbi:MAG: hydroxyisourate hydrolase [Alteromonadaceae bacterium]|nr:hydroxyisourate hydrolase [Alteromonadaceae bacterium]
MPSLSSHVLDTTLGKPAEAMKLTLTCPDGSGFNLVTNADGRVSQWPDINLVTGTYQLRFHTGDYLQAHHGSQFYPFADVHFEMEEQHGHYHIPLLISPYGFSTYRGS